jgi:predicted amidohydrolase
MDVLAIQIDIAWEDPPKNFARVEAMLEEAAVPKNAIVVLPEMFATGFSMNVDAIAEKDEGPTAQFLAQTAVRYEACVVGGVVTRAADGRGRNEAFVFGPDGARMTRYQKIHPFSFANEDDHFEAGTDVVTFTWQGFTVAPFICYDLRFPEAFRRAVRVGADLFLVIANWPASRSVHWDTLLRARAIENQAYVVGVNRCGADPKLAYAGGSRIVDPRGETLVEANGTPTLLRATLNLDELQAYRAEFPALNDMKL